MNRISPTIHKYLLAGTFTVAIIPSLSAQTHKSTQQADWQIEQMKTRRQSQSSLKVRAGYGIEEAAAAPILS